MGLAPQPALVFSAGSAIGARGPLISDGHWGPSTVSSRVSETVSLHWARLAGHTEDQTANTQCRSSKQKRMAFVPDV